MSSRNIVAVSIDSLRGDHCGYLGDDRGLTPTLDRLADEGVAYQNAVAPGPQTFSSMPAMFTGKSRPPTTLEDYPQESHWSRRLAAIDDHLGRHATIAERLQDVGYDTAGVTPNPWASSASGFDRGFDVFEDSSGGGTDGWASAVADRLPGVDTDARPVELVLNMLSGSEFFTQWETLNTQIQAARERLSEPYFLWVFVLDTHFPFLPTRQHREEQSLLGAYHSAYRSSPAMRGNRDSMSPRTLRSVERSYRDTVRASDTFLERLQSELVDDDPVMVIHADHGESFGDHDNYGHHHRQVYDENVHVPYVIHNADVCADVPEPVSLASIYDTVVDIAHDGTFDPDEMTTSYAVASSECGTYRAVRGTRFKYLEGSSDFALFDLARDADEQQDVSAAHPDLCGDLRRRLARVDRHTAETARIIRGTEAIAARRNV